VKKAHRQIYGLKQWIQPLPMAANVASRCEGIQNLQVPASQKIKHMQNLTRRMHLNTLKKYLSVQQREK